MTDAALFIRCYLDQHVPIRFAVDVRQRGFEAVIAHEIGMARASDHEHLTWASTHGFMVLTSDFDDVPRLAETGFFEGRDHAGILLLEQPGRISYGVLLRRLLRFLNDVAADEMTNHIEWLDGRWDPGTDE